MLAVVIGYPRSGTTMTEFLLRNARPPVQTDKLHGHDLIREEILSIQYAHLILVLRHYRECVMSQLTRGNEQNDLAKIKTAFVQYMIGIATFEASECPKTVIYYEDLLEQPVEIVKHLADFMRIDMSHIINDVDAYLQTSRQNYIRKLGKPLTSGKETTYFAPLTYSNYEFDWDKEVRSLQPDLYDKYLKRYGDNNA